MGYIQISGSPAVVVDPVTGICTEAVGLATGTYPYSVRATEDREGVTVYGAEIHLTHSVVDSVYEYTHSEPSHPCVIYMQDNAARFVSYNGKCYERGRKLEDIGQTSVVQEGTYVSVDACMRANPYLTIAATGDRPQNVTDGVRLVNTLEVIPDIPDDITPAEITALGVLPGEVVTKTLVLKYSPNGSILEDVNPDFYDVTVQGLPTLELRAVFIEASNKIYYNLIMNCVDHISSTVELTDSYNFAPVGFQLPHTKVAYMNATDVPVTLASLHLYGLNTEFLFLGGVILDHGTTPTYPFGNTKTINSGIGTISSNTTGTRVMKSAGYQGINAAEYSIYYKRTDP